METENNHIDIDLLTRYLAAETDEKENASVEAWIAASAGNRKEFESLKTAWDTLEKTDPGQEINIDREWNQLQSFLHQGRNAKLIIFRPAFIRVAASILVVLGLGMVLIRHATTSSVKTPATQTCEVLLADGSKVTLNADSKLTYNRSFNTNERVVRLVGEGYFEIQKDSSKPFIIQLSEAEVRVLGTTFNVKAYKEAEKIEVTVTEGRVTLYEKEQKQKQVIAAKGEKAEYDKKLKAVKKTVNNNPNAIAWKTKIVDFQNNNMVYVINTLKDVYHEEFVISNEALSTCSITAHFENKDLESVLRILESTLDITIKEDHNRFILTGPGCN
jgi:transmembrane sensor